MAVRRTKASQAGGIGRAIYGEIRTALPTPTELKRRLQDDGVKRRKLCSAMAVVFRN